MSTVNGRTLRDVLKDLQAYREPPHKTRDGYGYFKAAEFVSAFDEIVGVANYNIEYTDYQYQITSAGQEIYSVKCIITILDDESRPVLKRECYGSCECKYSKETGKVVNLQNSTDFVCSYAFKNAAKRFGIFGLKTKDAEGGYTEPQKAPKQRQNDTKNEVGPTKDNILNFITDGAFWQVKEDNGRPVYKVAAYEMIGGEKQHDTVSHIIFYPNQYSKDAATMNKIISRCTTSQSGLRIKTKACKEDNDGIKQYVFLGFASA